MSNAGVPMLIRIARVYRVMSLFRKAGKKFEETKKSFLDGKDADFVCTACEEPVAEEYEYCPHCGDGPIEPVE